MKKILWCWQTICTVIKIVQCLSCSVHLSEHIAVCYRCVLSLEIEPQFELKLSVLDQKVEFYPTKCLGDLDWTPIGDENN